MGLVMELRDRRGSVLAAAGENLGTIDEMLPEVDPVGFPLLASIDRDDVTMFNRGQQIRLRKELERLLPDAPARREKVLRALIALCEQGSVTVDSQLWVIGE